MNAKLFIVKGEKLTGVSAKTAHPEQDFRNRLSEQRYEISSESLDFKK